MLVFLFVALSPFQDFFLQNYGLGIFGSSVSSLLLTLIIIYNITVPHSKKLTLVLLLVFIYIAILFMISIFEYEHVIHYENIYLKSAKTFAMLFYVYYAVFFVNYKSASVKNGIYTAFLMSIFGLFLSLYYSNSFDSIPLFHASENSNLRPRGFAMESSMLSIEVIVLGFLTMHFLRSKLVTSFVFVLIVLSTYFIDSKGGTIVLVIAICVSYILWLDKGFREWAFCIILIIGAMSIIMHYIYMVVPEDIANHTTYGTRFLMLLVAANIVYQHPFGVGVGGYLFEIQNSITAILEQINLGLNYSEIHAYAEATEYKNISAKSFLLNGIILLGVPFAIFYICSCMKIINNLLHKKNFSLMVAVIFSTISLATFVDAFGSYTHLIALGLAWSYKASNLNVITSSI